MCGGEFCVDLKLSLYCKVKDDRTTPFFVSERGGRMNISPAICTDIQPVNVMGILAAIELLERAREFSFVCVFTLYCLATCTNMGVGLLRLL